MRCYVERPPTLDAMFRAAVAAVRGTVVDKRVEEGAHLVELEVRIQNQLGDITADGTSIVELPHANAGEIHDSSRRRRRSAISRNASTRSWTSTSIPTSAGTSTKRRRSGPSEDVSDRRGAQAQGTGGGTVEPVRAGQASRGRSHQLRVRAPVRDHGALAAGAGVVQLQRARHRQHGNAHAVRHAGAAGALAHAAARRRDPLVLRHDRAGRRVERCDQRAVVDRPGRRRLRHQRAQVVHDGRHRSALQDLHLHGQDGSRPTRTATASSR